MIIDFHIRIEFIEARDGIEVDLLLGHGRKGARRSALFALISIVIYTILVGGDAARAAAEFNPYATNPPILRLKRIC